MNVLILNGSPRKNGNTSTALRAIEDGLKARHTVESLTKSVETEIKSIEFAQISENLRSFLSTAIRTSKTLDETLFNVNNGVDALIELILYIDSDPSALIQGKKKPKADDAVKNSGK